LAYKIDFKSSVFRDLKHLDKKAARRITKELRKTLSENPNSGEPLTGQFKGMLKLRIGDYRVIYSRTREGVLILRIRHRSSAYER